VGRFLPECGEATLVTHPDLSRGSIYWKSHGSGKISGMPQRRPPDFRGTEQQRHSNNKVRSLARII
jgi:hypothetical protein